MEDVLFADDTLLIGRSSEHIEEYMAAVEAKGMDYGLQVHWGKVHLVGVCSAASIKSPTGDEIKSKSSILYLGAPIHADGKFGCEVSRKIGAAAAEFRALQPVWRCANIGKHRKLELFEALVLSKVLYGVASAWLSKADLGRLDGFQAGCLRKMLQIPASYVSRVSNEAVRKTAGQDALSNMVRTAQLKLMGKVLNDDAKRILRDVAFQGSTTLSANAAYVRRIGRPRHNWTEQVFREWCSNR